MGRPKKAEGEEKAEYREADETAKDNLGKIVKAFIRTYGRLEKVRTNRRVTRNAEAVDLFNSVTARLAKEYGKAFGMQAEYREPTEDEEEEEQEAFDVDSWLSG
jgi:hypothetical protein